MDYKNIVTAPNAAKGFYPTPLALAKRLLEGVDWNRVKEILEPSAGKGDLIWATALLAKKQGYDELCVDAVEIDPALRAALAARFSDEEYGRLKKEFSDLNDARNARSHYEYDVQKGYDTSYDFPDGEPRCLTEAEQEHMADLEKQISAMDKMMLHIVGDDFLEFNTIKRYDLVVINPPFADGDKHLLKAISMTERYGGEIRYILNAETLRNPYSLNRKLLRQKLAALEADIEFVQDAFADAEHKTNVEVALVRVSIPAPESGNSDIWDRLTKAKENEPKVTATDPADLVVADRFAGLVAQFEVECKAGIELMKSYAALAPYLLSDITPNKNPYLRDKPNLTLKVGENGDPDDVNKFLRLTRRKYWKAMFNDRELMGKLSTRHQQKWQSKVNELDNYDFSLYNIRQIMLEMRRELLVGIEDSIMEMFHKLTDEHAWYADAKTIHYFTGWKTNKAHKIGRKVILPANGAYERNDIWGVDTFDAYDAYGALRDLEKVLNYFDGEGMYATADMRKLFERLAHTGSTGMVRKNCDPPKNIRCKHFSVSFFKKGTVHITFHDEKLVDRFNIYCGRQSNELPPDYGKKAYNDLSREEKTVVDSFHGDGSEGSGEKGYTKVYQDQALYLSEPTKKTLMALPAKEA